MSDYRNFNDPLARGTHYDPAARRSGSSWAWIVGALFVIFVLAVAFGVNRPHRVASNSLPPPASHMAPPVSRGLNPATPMNPANPAPPLSPMTPAPAPTAPTHS